MMFKLSLISLCLLSAGNIMETESQTFSLATTGSTATTSFRATTSFTTFSMTAITTFKTTTNFQMPSKPKGSPNSETNPNSKTTSKHRTTLKTAVAPKIPTTMNSGSTTLNRKDNIHFLFYVIFLLFCVQWSWSGLELSAFLAQFFITCWMTTSTLRKSNLFQLLGNYHYPTLIWLFANYNCVSLIITLIWFPSL